MRKRNEYIFKSKVSTDCDNDLVKKIVTVNSEEWKEPQET